MSPALAQTSLFTLPPTGSDFKMAIFYHGAWKVQRMNVPFQEAEATARSVHQRTSLIVQVRGLDESVLCQFGYPVCEADGDDAWEEEEE